jgi:hypothetical protein
MMTGNQGKNPDDGCSTSSSLLLFFGLSIVETTGILKSIVIEHKGKPFESNAVTTN